MYEHAYVSVWVCVCIYVCVYMCMGLCMGMDHNRYGYVYVYGHTYTMYNSSTYQLSCLYIHKQTCKHIDIGLTQHGGQDPLVWRLHDRSVVAHQDVRTLQLKARLRYRASTPLLKPNNNKHGLIMLRKISVDEKLKGLCIWRYWLSLLSLFSTIQDQHNSSSCTKDSIL